MAKTNTNQLVQITLIRRDQLFRQLKGVSAEMIQNLHQAPIILGEDQTAVNGKFNAPFIHQGQSHTVGKPNISSLWN